ncbi:MAG: DNA polymerase IV [Candidatus Bathyarchaeia archaeon]
MVLPSEDRRIVIHVDMDSFFSAIEVRENPKLKGLPVVVGADPKGGKGRGVVSTASYEAREFGIRSGMPISRAYKLCPHGVFLPVNMPLYRRVSTRIMDILRKYADKFQRWGLDEAFLEVTKKAQTYGGAKKLALKIKKEIRRREGLTCSIGVGPNKLIAKVASDHQKPDGLTMVEPDQRKDFLAPLPVRKIPGVGRKTERALGRLGVRTIGQLARVDRQTLTSLLGKWGDELYYLARGIDQSEVEEGWERKSVGSEHTFEKDTDDTRVLDETLEAMIERIHRSITEEGYAFRTITLKVRFEDFETHTSSRSVDHSTSDIGLIKKISRDLLREYLGRGKRFRLVGIRLSNLEKVDKDQRPIDAFLSR